MKPLAEGENSLLDDYEAEGLHCFLSKDKQNFTFPPQIEVCTIRMCILSLTLILNHFFSLLF